MRSKLFSLFAILMVAALVLGACAKPTPAPTEVPTEAPTEAPVATEAPTEAPTEPPVVDPWADVVPAKEIVWFICSRDDCSTGTRCLRQAYRGAHSGRDCCPSCRRN